MVLSSCTSVVFLACVNSIRKGKRLKYLVNERKAIVRIISSAQKSANLEAIEKVSCQKQYLFDLLQDKAYRDRIKVIHLVGHADDDHLAIESDRVEASIHRDELSKLLALLPHLQAVFLSGCATPGLVKSLIKRDIPAVFVTASSDKSTHATELVKLFYKTLAQGKSFWQCLKTVQDAFPVFQPRPLTYDLDNDKFKCKDLRGPGKIPWGMYYLMDNLSILSQRMVATPLLSPMTNPPIGLKDRLKSTGKMVSFAASAITLGLLAVGVTWLLFRGDGLNMWLNF